MIPIKRYVFFDGCVMEFSVNKDANAYWGAGPSARLDIDNRVECPHGEYVMFNGIHTTWTSEGHLSIGTSKMSLKDFDK